MASAKRSPELPLEDRVLQTLTKVFGFNSFKTSLQGSATMTVVK
ncbi:putative ATP-dependent DNA helicase protein, partial [Naja naja]